MRRALRLCESGFPRLVVLFAAVYAAIRLSAFRGLADLRASSFEPVGILWFLGSPLPDAVWFGVLGLLFVSGLVVLTGRAARPAMVVFTPCVLVVTTYRSSWGQLLWFENLLVIHLIVLTVAAVTGPIDAIRPPPWAMQCCAVATVVLYVLAGLAKLRYGGLGWISGDVLANHIGYSSARLSVFGEQPPLLASFAVNHPGALTIASFATVTSELGAPLALLGRRLAIVWSSVMWATHVGIALTMAVVFPYPLVGLAFVPVVAVAGCMSLRRTGTK